MQALRRSLPVVVLGLTLAGGAFGAPGTDVQWTSGPATVALGSQAEMKLAEGYAFAGAADTQKLMRAMGNSVSSREVGLINPKAKEQEWILVFEYDAVGYVKDDEKDKIDKQ